MLFEYLISAVGASPVRAIITGLLISYCISSIGTAIYNIYFHRLAKYPGPTLRVAFHFPDALSKLRGKAYKDIKLLHDQYGSIVRTAPNALSFNTAPAWKDIYALKTDRTELAKDPIFYKRSNEAPSILVSNQTDHARFRKLLAHAISDTALLEQEPLLTFYFDLLVSKLKQRIDDSAQSRVDMAAYYNFTTFDIIGDLVLGECFGALESGKYHSWIRNVFESVKFLGVIRFAATYPVVGLSLKFLHILMPSLSAKRAAHFEFTKTKIEQRLDRETDRKDIMTYILRHNDERGMTRDEIMSTSRNLLTAGSETTATSLSGATYYLLQNPAVLRRLQSEIREAFKTAADITLRSVTTPGLLPYLEAVLQESLRCYPPIPAALPRMTGPEGALIDGHFVPGNVSVGVHQWSTYRNSANFASPNTFVPERWLPNAPAAYHDDNGAALQPFSLGPRGCIGKSLAHFEMCAILARVLWHFELQIIDDVEEEEDCGWVERQREYIFWDKGPLWVRLGHRSDATGRGG